MDFAARLAEGCVKVYEFWNAIQGAPGDIKVIKDDFDTIAVVLDQLKGRRLDRSVERILKTCQGMIKVRDSNKRICIVPLS